MIYKLTKSKVLIGIILVLVVINFLQFKTNRDYEEYMSSNIRDNMTALSSSILQNDIILEQALKDNKISYLKLNQLGSNFYSISMSYQQLERIYDIKSEKMLSNSTFLIAFDCSLLISLKMLGKSGHRYFTDDDNHTIIPLSSQHIERFKTMKEVTKAWSDIINDNVKGATPTGMEDIYRTEYHNAIRNNYWRKVLHQLDDYNKNLNWDSSAFLNSDI